MTKPNEQHQFDILYIPHNFFEGNTYKYVLTGADVASRYKVARPLKIKKSGEVVFVLEVIYKTGGVFEYPKIFQCDNGSEFKNEVQNYLKNTMLILEEQQQNTSILMRPLWRPLTKRWQDCCLNRRMFKSFKTLKYYRQFGLKI